MSGPEQKPVLAATFHLDAEALALVDRLAAAYRLGRGDLVLHALRSLRTPSDVEACQRPPQTPPASLAEALAAVRADLLPGNPSQQLQELPHGVFEGADGSYRAKCRACGRDYELFGTPEEFTEEGNYCGGSPGCTP